MRNETWAKVCLFGMIILPIFDIAQASTVAPISIPKKKVVVIRVDFQQSAACSGFDSSVSPHAIMAPEGGNNTASAVITPASVAGKVNFITNPSNATVSPSPATASPQMITVSGVAHSDSLLTAKTATSRKLGSLDVSVKSRLNQTVAIHAITQDNDDVQVIPVGQGTPNQPCVRASSGTFVTTPSGDDVVSGNTITTGPNGICETTAQGSDIQVLPVGRGQPFGACVGSGPNGYRNTNPSGDDQVSGQDINSGADGICNTAATKPLVPTNVPTASDLQAYLNQVWGQEANVFFVVSRADKTVNYDLNRNGGVDAAPTGFSTEENLIRTAALDSTRDINIYYVNTYLLGTANAATAGKETFVQDSHANSAVNITAHEVGHALGIRYESNDTIDVMLNFSSANNPCNVKKVDWDTVNP